MIIDKFIKNINEYIDSLEKDLGRREIYWFRGHSNKEWKLLPHLARTQKWLKTEMNLIARFQQDSTLLMSNTPQKEWEWLTIMQHHGTPTRLLDWTESPLVALYFAVSEMYKNDAAVWVLIPRILNKEANIKYSYKKHIPNFEDERLRSYMPTTVASEKITSMNPVAVIGPRNTPRMQAQLGVFTIMHREAIAIENIGQKKHIGRYIVPKKYKKEILNQLSQIKVGKFSLFPELQSIGEILRKDLK